MLPLFLPNIQGTELLIIALVVLVLFGGRKIPEFMKGIGKGIKSFKDGVNNIQDDINATDEKEVPEKKVKDKKK